MDPQPTKIRARDGFALAATIYEPSAPRPDGREHPTVLIVPATAVRRSLYDGFARHLVAAGYRAVTWDWRGTGDSRPESLKDFQATMTDWARLDLAGVFDHVESSWPEARRLAVGHSFGGQSLGLVPESGRLQGAVLVAAQSGYWGHWPLPRKLGLAFVWTVLIPVVTWILGWFPGRQLGLGGDLPAGVAGEWALWCRTPEFLGGHVGWDGHRALHIPMEAFAITDDPFAPRRAVEALCREYGSDVPVHDVAPGDVGVRQLGHFGMFKPGAPAFWDRVLESLDGSFGSE